MRQTLIAAWRYMNSAIKDIEHWAVFIAFSPIALSTKIERFLPLSGRNFKNYLVKPCFDNTIDCVI